MSSPTGEKKPEFKGDVAQATLSHVSSNKADVVAAEDAKRTESDAGSRYHILRPHAKGGLGQVYVARDSELRREVALKEIQERHAQSGENRARFLLEAEVTGGLEHPGIVPVYGMGAYADGRPYYAMRFIRGESLKDAIAHFHKPSSAHEGAGSEETVSLDSVPDEKGREGAFLKQTRVGKTGAAFRMEGERLIAFRKLLGRFLDVCQAVAYAHSRGILHRDLKPGNIMLGKFGETLVVDWGLAKRMESTRTDVSPKDSAAPSVSSEAPLSPSTGAETLAGTTVGTPAYMSPEQAAGKLELLGPESDVYSLGATLYHLMTGRAPFREPDVAACLRNVIRGEFPSPRMVSPSIPLPLEAICLKSMASQGADRYASPKDLADDIEHWLADEPVAAWREPWTVKTRRWMRRRRAWVTGVSAAVLVGVVTVVGGLFWYQGEQNRRATEKAVLDAEARRKTTDTEESVRDALQQAETLQAKLRADLAVPGGVFALVDDPARWEGRIQIPRAFLERSRALLSNTPDADPALVEHLKRLVFSVGKDETDREFALRLEAIRMDRANLSKDELDNVGALHQYEKAFAQAGLDVLEAPSDVLAERINGFTVREQIVAALEDWALLAYWQRKPDVSRVILRSVRQAAPDPHWGDQVRQFELWKDSAALAKFLEKPRPHRLSPQQYSLIGSVLLLREMPLAESWLREAQAHYPSDFWLNHKMGVALQHKDLREAVGFLRAAIAIRPSAIGYVVIASLLERDGKLDEADAALRKAIDFSPDSVKFALIQGDFYRRMKDSPKAHLVARRAIASEPRNPDGYRLLGDSLRDLKDPAGAIAAYRQCLKLGPGEPSAHYRLGLLLRDEKKSPEALEVFREAVKLFRRNGYVHYGLAMVLRDQKKYPEAAASYLAAARADPKLGEAFYYAGDLLLFVGDYAAALPALTKASEVFPEKHKLRAKCLTRLAKCKSLALLDDRLSVYQKSRGVESPSALLELADFCLRYKKQFAAASRLYVAAFQGNPTLAGQGDGVNRANAIRAALQAGFGTTADGGGVSKEEQREMQGLAKAWMSVYFQDQDRVFATAMPVDLLQLDAALASWQADPALALFRDEKHLAQLPDEEKKWLSDSLRRLTELHQRVDAQFTVSRTEGDLEPNPDPKLTRKGKLHPWKLVAGRTYIIDLQSAAFDTVLDLHDAAGKLLYSNDDFRKGSLNSRIVYTARSDGLYRLTVRSFQAVLPTKGGPYSLTVREFLPR